MPIRDVLKRSLGRLKQPFYDYRRNQYMIDRNSGSNGRRLLVIMNGGIGNAIEATPLVQGARMHWPKASLTIAAPAGDLFRDWCVVDRTVTQLTELAGESFDTTFVTHGSQLIPSDFDLGIAYGEIERLPYVGGVFLKPEREYNFDMLRRLGYKGETPPLYVAVTEPESEIEQIKPLVILAPGGKPSQRWRNKRWPYFTELAREILRASPELSVGIVGTKDDEFIHPFPDDDRLLDLRGKLTLSETAGLMRAAEFVIGNDCGPMHIADAVQARALVIFGPTCEIKNGPRYKGSIISSDPPCRPCQYDEQLLMTCDNPICMKDISVAQVMARVREIVRTELQTNNSRRD